LLHVGRILFEPLLQLARGFWRDLLEAQTGLSARAFPRKLSREFKARLGSGQGEGDLPAASGTAAVWHGNCHASFTQVDGSPLHVGADFGTSHDHWNLHGDPGIAASLALHQSPRSPEA